MPSRYGTLPLAERDGVETLVELVGAGKTYGRHPAVVEVSMSVERGMATALLGRNGSGKSTLLTMLGGLTRLSSGEIRYIKRRLSISYAPERLPGLKYSAEEYIRDMGRIAGVSGELLERRMDELFHAFDLQSFRTGSMAGYSKGMLQKVNLIQSLLPRPELLLLDEPLSGLDLESQQQLLEMLREMKRSGTAIVYATHELAGLETLADKVHVLQAGSTVKVLNGGDHLRLSPSTYIVCTIEDHRLAAECPSLLACEELPYVPGSPRFALTVAADATEDALRHLLAAGCSILAVERRGGLAELQPWTEELKVREGAAG